MGDEVRDPIAWLLLRRLVTPARVKECKADCPRPDDPFAVMDLLVSRRYVDPVEVAALVSLLSAPRDTARPPLAAALPDFPTIDGTPELPAAQGTTAAPGSPGEQRRRRVAHYEVDSELGRGGMGVVYKAWDSKLSRWVALKILQGVESVHDPRLARFHREARTAARLQHPHVVQVHEVGESDAGFYIAMDLIQGRTLRKAIEDGSCGFREGARLLRQIAGALAYAHEHGVVHRDVKPENILLDEAGEAHLSDFGLAKELGDATRMTLSGAVLGTPAYMSPEQAEGDIGRVGRASDVYGVGAVLYEVLTGKPPFRGTGVMEVLYHVMHTEVARPTLANPRVPRDLELVCLKCLEKEPVRRYANAVELADDLDLYLAGEAVRARPASMTYRVRRWAWRRKGVVVSMATAAAALLVALGIGWKARQAAMQQERSLVDNEFYRTTQVAVERALARQRLGDRAQLVKLVGATVAAAEEQIRSDPEAAGAYFVKGWLLRLGGAFKEAESALSEAARRRPHDASVRYQRGLARAELLGQAIHEAQTRLQSLRPLDELLPAAAVSAEELEGSCPELGEMRQAAKEDFEEVNRQFDAGRAADLGPAARMCGQAILAGYSGDLAQARLLLDQCLSMDPTTDEAWEATLQFTVRSCFDGLNTWDDLISDCTRAMQANQGHHLSWTFRAEARAYNAQAAWLGGEREEAVRLWSESVRDIEQALLLASEVQYVRIAKLRILTMWADARDEMGEDTRPCLREAAQLASAAVARQPGDSSALHIRAFVLLRLGGVVSRRGEDPRELLARALADLDAALEQNPGSIDAYLTRGGCHDLLARDGERRGVDPREEHRKAIADYTRALQLSPNGAFALHNRAMSHKRLAHVESVSGGDPTQELDAAFADVERALSLAPRLAGTYLTRGNAYVARARWQHARRLDPQASCALAIEAFTGAIRIDPAMDSAYLSRTGARLLLGRVKRTRGVDPEDDFRAAFEDLGRAVRLNPESPSVHPHWGEAWLYLGEDEAARGGDPEAAFNAAIAEFGKAVKHDPADPDTRDWLAKAHGAMADLQKSRGRDPREEYRGGIAELDASLGMKPNVKKNLRQRAWMHMYLGDAEGDRGNDPRDCYRRSIGDFGEVIRLDPNDPAARVDRGFVYGQRLLTHEASRGGDAGECASRAFADFDEAIRLDSSLVHPYESKGGLLLHLGRTAEAIACYEAAVRIVGDRYPSLLKALASARERIESERSTTPK